MPLPRSKISVSVIMPARNVSAYVEEAIRSALDQRGVVYELLIGDDASGDDTWKCISKFRNDFRVRAWRFRKKRGAGAVRNYLISRAKGVYIAFCDADDKMLPGFLRTMVRVLDRDPGLGVVYSDRLVKDRSGRIHRHHRSRGPAETWDLIDGPISNGGTVIRRELFKKIKGYRAELFLYEDYDLFWRLAEVARFKYIKSKPLYLYRKRPGALSNRSKQKLSAAQLDLLQDVIFRRYGVRPRW